MSQPTKYAETVAAAEHLADSYLTNNGLIAEFVWMLAQFDDKFYKARVSSTSCDAVLYGLRDAIDIRLAEGKWPDEWPL